MGSFPALPGHGSTFRSHRRRIGWYERTFARNTGILRCMLQMSGTDPEIPRLWHERNARIVDRAEAETMARPKSKPRDPQLLRLVIRAAGTIIDQSPRAAGSAMTHDANLPDPRVSHAA